MPGRASWSGGYAIKPTVIQCGHHQMQGAPLMTCYILLGLSQV
jgi:hypothetical protein